MKTTVIIIVSLFLLALLTTCDKNDNNMTKGVIIGWDWSYCLCCGGLMINLNSDSSELHTVDTRYIDKFPDNLVLETTTVFPIFIWLDYSNSDANCGQAINITRFEYR